MRKVLTLLAICSVAFADIPYGRIQKNGTLQYIITRFNNHNPILGTLVPPKSLWIDGIMVTAKTELPTSTALRVTVSCGDRSYSEVQSWKRDVDYTMVLVRTDGCEADSILVEELAVANSIAETR